MADYAKREISAKPSATVVRWMTRTTYRERDGSRTVKYIYPKPGGGYFRALVYDLRSAWINQRPEDGHG